MSTDECNDIKNTRIDTYMWVYLIVTKLTQIDRILLGLKIESVRYIHNNISLVL